MPRLESVQRAVLFLLPVGYMIYKTHLGKTTNFGATSKSQTTFKYLFDF